MAAFLIFAFREERTCFYCAATDGRFLIFALMDERTTYLDWISVAAKK